MDNAEISVGGTIAFSLRQNRHVGEELQYKSYTTIHPIVMFVFIATVVWTHCLNLGVSTRFPHHRGRGRVN